MTVANTTRKGLSDFYSNQCKTSSQTKRTVKNKQLAISFVGTRLFNVQIYLNYENRVSKHFVIYLNFLCLSLFFYFCGTCNYFGKFAS